MAVTRFFEDWLSSWSGNRPEELLKYYHPDIFYSDPAHKSGLKGVVALENYLTRLLVKNPHWKWELIHADQVSESRYYVKWKATIPTKDKTVVELGLDLVELKDGLIIHNEVYFDTRSL